MTDEPTAAPRRRPGVVAHDVGGRTVLRDADGRDLCELNETAKALWELCDGETSTAEMVDAICEVHDATPDAVQRDVYGAIATFREVGVLG